MSKASNVHDLLSVSIGGVSIANALEDFNAILNTCLLVIGILNVALVLFFKIYNLVKKKKNGEEITEKDIEDISNTIKDFKNEIKRDDK